MIYITGDTHADFHKFGASYFGIDYLPTSDDFVIICGDFGGLWDGSKREMYWLNWLSERPFTTLFISGNHENFDALAKVPISEWMGGKVQFITDKIIHLMRGQVFTVENKTIFTMGGASSHDIDAGILEPDDPDLTVKCKRLNKQMAAYRINHISWWKEEIPNKQEFDEGLKNLELHNWSVDYIITHCAPISIQDIIGRGFYKQDALTDYLETIYQNCSFKKWFFGHYHEDKMIGDKFCLLYNNIVPVEKDS